MNKQIIIIVISFMIMPMLIFPYIIIEDDIKPVNIKTERFTLEDKYTLLFWFDNDNNETDELLFGYWIN